MKTPLLAATFAIFALALPQVCPADQATAQALGILDEKVSRLTAQIEDLQVRSLHTQKEIEKLQNDQQELRRVAAAGGGVTGPELKALEDRIAAVDAARQRDRQAIIEQLAKELAGVGGGTRPVARPVSSDGKEHVVAKGETLSAIAKTHGITVAELRRANGLTGDDLRIGQKLTIPGK